MLLFFPKEMTEHELRLLNCVYHLSVLAKEMIEHKFKIWDTSTGQVWTLFQAYRAKKVNFVFGRFCNT
jgi:hypothetical protein